MVGMSLRTNQDCFEVARITFQPFLFGRRTTKAEKDQQQQQQQQQQKQQQQQVAHLWLRRRITSSEKN